MYRFLLVGTAAGSLISCPSGYASEHELVARLVEQSQLDLGWDGPYIGAQIGVAFSDTNYLVNAPIGNTLTSSQNGFGDTGALGGIYAGYNFDFDNFVIGVEGDIVALDVAGEDYFFGAKTDETISQSVDWLSTLRVRAGYGTDSHLYYVTGGIAAGYVNAEYNYQNTAIPTFFYDGSTSGIEFGWVLGAGGEFRLDENWSMRMDFMHVELNETSLSAFNAFNGVTNTVQFDNELNIAKVGFTFHF